MPVTAFPVAGSAAAARWSAPVPGIASTPRASSAARNRRSSSVPRSGAATITLPSDPSRSRAVLTASNCV